MPKGPRQTHCADPDQTAFEEFDQGLHSLLVPQAFCYSSLDNASLTNILLIPALIRLTIFDNQPCT